MSPSMCYVCDVAHQERCVLMCREERKMCDITHVTHRGRHHTSNTSRKMCDITYFATSFSMCYVCDVAHHAYFPENCRISVVLCRTSFLMCYSCYLAHLSRRGTCVMSHIVPPSQHTATHLSWWVMSHIFLDVSCHTHRSRRGTGVMPHIVLPSLHTNTHLSWWVISHIFLDVSCHTHRSRRGKRVTSHIVPPSQHTATHLSWCVMSHIFLPTSPIYHEVSHLSYHPSFFLPYTLSHIFCLS